AHPVDDHVATLALAVVKAPTNTTIVVHVIERQEARIALPATLAPPSIHLDDICPKFCAPPLLVLTLNLLEPFGMSRRKALRVARKNTGMTLHVALVIRALVAAAASAKLKATRRLPLSTGAA